MIRTWLACAVLVMLGGMNISNPHTSVLRCQIAYNEHGAYCVPSSSQHRPAAAAILAGKVWEPDTIRFITSHCGTGDVVHAGTFFGDFLPALSRAAGKVWAFEPNRENFRCAHITGLLNEMPNVQLACAALGDSARKAKVATTDAAGRSLGGASHVSASGNQDANIVAIDQIVPQEREVSIIQLDVEGFEQLALTGALKTIERCRPVLILETLPQTAWIESHLAPLGYRITQAIHGNTVFATG